jgi:glyoxylase-like metal-dependent hydrolase (beta-lactamase superfamily II)
VNVRELKPRLWYWTALHPDWTPDESGENGWEPEVGSYAYVSPDLAAFVLFDPLVPEDDGALWDAIDADVEHHGAPHVLITVPWHWRSSQAVLDRYPGARVWAHAPAREELGAWTTVTDVFHAGDRLPGGVEAHTVGGSAHEVVYRIPEHEAVVVGDSLIARPGEPVRVWPDEESVPPALRALLEYPVELLLLTHGEPVLAGGGGVLARALEA